MAHLVAKYAYAEGKSEPLTAVGRTSQDFSSIPVKHQPQPPATSRTEAAALTDWRKNDNFLTARLKSEAKLEAINALDPMYPGSSPRRLSEVTPRIPPPMHSKPVHAYAHDILTASKAYGSLTRKDALDVIDSGLREMSIYATFPRQHVKSREPLNKISNPISNYGTRGLTSHTPVDKTVRGKIYITESPRRNAIPLSNMTRDVFGTDSYYLNKMNDILCRYPVGVMFTSSPSRVNDYMYIGGYADADNWPYLKRLGITHVLNMAGPRKSSLNPYPHGSGVIGYEMIDADDCENYDVMQHFPRAKSLIDKAKYSGGKVLVHCAMGINRSGAMCCAYLMAEEKLSLLDAVRRMKQARGTVLTNRAFQRQLLRLARVKGYL